MDSFHINASLAPDAVSKVTQLYAATTAEIMVETLQNARRAGATHVAITIRALNPDSDTQMPRTEVRVQDNGPGIHDPHLLLRYGASGWSEDHQRDEDCAGMGLLSLAQHGVVLRWTSRNDPLTGSRTELRPEHFRGEAPATVESCPPLTAPGTALEFTVPDSTYTVEDAVKRAARYGPLEVKLNNTRVPRQPFLQGALYTETWQGIELGLMGPETADYDHPERMSVRGMPVEIDLPILTDLHATNYTMRAYVDRCPELKLVLPSRRSVVRNSFRQALMREAERVLYRGLAHLDNTLNPIAYANWVTAKHYGIDLAIPAPSLIPCDPLRAAKRRADDPDYYDYHRLHTHATAIPPDAILVDIYGPTDKAIVHRAFACNGMAGRLFQPEQAYSGYPWYDRLPRLVNQTLHPIPPTPERPAGSFELTLTYADPDPTLAAFEAPTKLHTDLKLVRKRSTPELSGTELRSPALSPADLAHYLRATLGTDSIPHQLENRIQAEARTLLLHPGEHDASILEDLIRRHVLPACEHMQATVHLHNGDLSVTIHPRARAA